MRLNLRLYKLKSLFPNYLVLLLLVAFALTPIIILVFNSFKTSLELGKNAVNFPKSPVLDNYPQAWEQGQFSITMRNSLILVTGTVIGVLLLGGLAAYSLSRLEPPGGNIFTMYMLTLSTIPIWIYIIPLFVLWRKLALLDSLPGLILIYIALNSPFSIFLLRSYLLNLPRDFEDAARVDGANEIQVLTHVVFPMVWPAFLTIGLVVALAVWSEFQLALIFISDNNLLPLTTSYFYFRKRFGSNWSLVSAGAVMMIAPIIVVFLALQRRFIEGLTQGGIRS